MGKKIVHHPPNPVDRNGEADPDRAAGRAEDGRVEADHFAERVDQRPGETWQDVVGAEDNSLASAPAPAHALFLERVRYPAELYFTT